MDLETIFQIIGFIVAFSVMYLAFIK